MAGDWIKVEHATLDKPEVLRMAELLGVKQDEMLGVLLRFFVWLDRNCSHGYVTHMSRMCLDSVLHVSGFSAVLCDVGWAEMDDATGILTIKNWDRHNGNPAKTRALAKDRKAEERSRKSHADAVTREEKRREDKPQHLRAVEPQADLQSPHFTRFWDAYPATKRRVAKKACWDVWRRSHLDVEVEQIVAHVGAMATTESWTTGYEPAPLTYLHQRRWEDGLPVPAKQKSRVAL